MKAVKSLFPPFHFYKRSRDLDCSGDKKLVDSESDFDQLPIELVIEILKQLKPADQIRASCVCRQWRNLLDDEKDFNLKIREKIRNNETILLSFVKTINNLKELAQGLNSEEKFILVMSNKGLIRKVVKFDKFELKSLKQDEGAIRLKNKKKERIR